MGFTASVWARLLGAAGFCIVAVLLVLWAERPREHPRPVVVEATDHEAASKRALTITSTAPIETWQVQVLGRDQDGKAVDDFSWSGVVAIPDGESLVILSNPSEEFKAPNRALRVRLGDEPELIRWGGTYLTVTIEAP